MKLIYAKDGVLEKARKNNVQFIRLQFTDIFGAFKNIAITVDELPKALEGKMFFDCSVIEGSVQDQEKDIYLLPDSSTFVIFPWRPREGAVARLICDALTPEGKPFEACSRYILKQMLGRAKDIGFTLRVGAGIDFFLFHLDHQGKPTVITHDQAGYCDLTPLDLGENARRDMVLTLQEMGFDVSSSHHEIAPGQHRIFLKEDTALTMADSTVTFKFVVRTIAQRHGLHASFMPKPLKHSNGSGMHLYISLWQGEKNAFYTPEGPLHLSKVGYQFIAGLIEHAPALTAIANPLVNSYKRLAPIIAGWSLHNRHTMIRVPAQKEEEVRIVLRNPDPAANPYLLLAAVLAAGLDGINRQQDTSFPGEDVALNKLPCNLRDAIAALARDEVIGQALGEPVRDKFLKIKENEWERFQAEVHQWELDEYLTSF